MIASSLTLNLCKILWTIEETKLKQIKRSLHALGFEISFVMEQSALAKLCPLTLSSWLYTFNLLVCVAVCICVYLNCPHSPEWFTSEFQCYNVSGQYIDTAITGTNGVYKHNWRKKNKNAIYKQMDILSYTHTYTQSHQFNCKLYRRRENERKRDRSKHGRTSYEYLQRRDAKWRMGERAR